MNQLPQEPKQDNEPIALPPTHQEQPSKTGLIIALTIGLLALIALAGILLFRSRAAFGPTTTTNPFFFGAPTIPPTTAPTPFTTPIITPTPTPTPTTPIPSPTGGAHTVTITNLGISQMFGGTTTGTITLTPGTPTTVYIQGNASHTPNPPGCSALTINYAGTTTTSTCTTSGPGFQIPTSLTYSTVCSGITPGNQTSWTASVTATDTDSTTSASGSATATIQC